MSLGLGLNSNKDNEPWTPAHLPGLIHWYRKGIGITSDGDEVGGAILGDVSVWRDEWGVNHFEGDPDSNSHNAAPNLTSSNTILFNHSANVLSFAAELTLGEFAVYVKLNFDASATVATEDLFEKDSNNFLKLTGPTAGRVRIQGERHDFTIAEIVEGTPFVLGYERATNGDIMIYKDNVAGSASDGDDLNVAISTTLGITQIGKPATDAEWYELVISNTVLTAGQRSDLYQYMSNIK